MKLMYLIFLIGFAVGLVCGFVNGFICALDGRKKEKQS